MDSLDAKKQAADEVLSALTPHMSSQLGGNLGYGVHTFGADLVPQASEAIKLWVKQNDDSKLIATVMAATAMQAITEEKADELIAKIKKASKAQLS